MKTLFFVKQSASNWLKHKGEFIGTMLEQLRNPGAAFGTRTGELLSLVSLCLSLHLLHFPPLSAFVYTLDRQKSSGYCTVPKLIFSVQVTVPDLLACFHSWFLERERTEPHWTRYLVLVQLALARGPCL